jgi:predicted small secreted protein
MRRTIHRTTPALVALALVLAGCGTRAGSGEGGDSHTVSPSPTRTASRGGCSARAMLDVADSGRTVCLTSGGDVRITLDGTRGRPWKPITVSGAGLEAVNSGFVLLPGDASAAFKGVSPGTTRLASTRPLCAAETGRISCKGLQEWRVTVVVR